MGITVLMINSCAYNHVEENEEHITLIWYKNPANQSEQSFKTGLAWLFSYLGASLPKNNFDKGISIKEEKVKIKLEYLGFSSIAKNALIKIFSQLKESGEYQEKEAIDAGRFFALCFNSSWNYYSITGVDKNFATFQSRFSPAQAKVFALDSSSIATEGRLIIYHLPSGNLTATFFTAEEGHGYFSSNNFIPSGNIEVFDYMANGQPRFAIFDEAGKLKVGNNNVFSQAGKPAKCMWCHESKMQPLFRTSPDITGYISLSEFDADQKNFNSYLKAFHDSRKSYINFSSPQDHTQGEIIYLSFFEPNAERLAEEWGISQSDVLSRLQGIATHSNPEFPFLTDVYHRSEVDNFAPYPVLKTCDDARNSGGYEPNYLE